MSDKNPKEKLERRSSKSRLAKQSEVEEVEVEEEDNSPCSEASDATIVPAGIDTPVVSTPGGSPDSNSPEENKKLQSQQSTDSDKSSPTQGTHPKVKVLVRSHALCDDASPPPEDSASSSSGSTTAAAPTTELLTVSPSLQPKGYNRKLEKDGSQSSMSEPGTSPCLSRDSSVETQYTDSTGVDLEDFIRMTLHKNPKDRIMLLKLEQDLTDFITQKKTEFLKFPQMTSYHRMLVHRVSAFFGLEHNVDQSGKCVIVNRTSSTRIPEFRFKENIRDEGSLEDQPKKQILKRESASLEEGRSPDRLSMDKKSKSFEEREEEYEKARARIFNQQDSASSQEVMLESPLSRSSTRHSSARSSKEDLRWTAEPRPWSSTDSSGYSTDTSTKLKLSVTKASSFGGVTVLTRGNSSSSSYSGGRMSKTDSLSSGVSSLGSPMTRPPPIPSSPPLDGQTSETSSSSHSAASPQHGDSPTPLHQISGDQGQMAIWVASSLDVIPPGSMIINKETGQPYTNADGSIYRYTPPTASKPNQLQVPVGLHALPPPTHVQPQNTLLQPPQPTYPPQITQQPPMLEQRQYSGESVGSDMTHQFTSMTITPQSSTESMPPPEPPGGQHQIYMVPPPTAAPPPPHSGASPHQQQPPQVQTQGYIQTQQVPYYPTSQSGTLPPGSQMRYASPCGYPPTMQQPSQLPPQGSVISQSSNGPQSSQYVGGQYVTQQPQPAQAQQQNQQSYPAMPVVGLPQMTVQAVESYQQPPPPPPQQQQQQPQQQQPQQQAYPQVGISLPGGYMSQQGQTLPPGTQDLSQQYQIPTASQAESYAQPQSIQQLPVHSYQYTPTSNNSQVLSYPSTHQPFRPRSPPSQTSLGQAGSSQQQYYTTTYPQGAQSQPRNQTPQSGYQGVQFPSGQPYTMVRPNMQMSLPQGGAPSGVAGAPQIKMINVDQRLPKSDYYQTEMVPKEGVPNGSQGHGQQVTVPVQKPLVPQIRPHSAPPPQRVSVCPADISRMVSPSLQQLPRPGMPQLLANVRPRYPSPGGQSQHQMGGKPPKGRKNWAKNGKDTGASPHSSTESTESLESLHATLEVESLPSNTKCADLELLLDDLIKQGGKLQVMTSDPSGQIASKPDSLVSECTVLVHFESDALAQRAMNNNKNPKFRLRPHTKLYEAGPS